MMRHYRAFVGLLGPVFRSSSGSTLLWMIGALVVLGSVAAGVALMSPSASRGKLEQEAGMRAYYNANAGLQFLNSANDAGESAKLDFSNFTSRMGGTGVVTYTMPDNGTFSYQLGNIQINGVNGTYQITNLYGTVQDKNNNSAYTYVVYGGGKGSSPMTTYTPSGGAKSGASKYVLFSEKSKLYVQGAADIIGDVYGASVETSQANIKGAVISQGNVVLGFSTVVTKSVCSMGDVSLDQSEVGGSINAAGNVDLKFKSKVKGDIYAGGKVTMATSATVEGEIHAQQTIATEFSCTVGVKSKGNGNVYANGNISLGNTTNIYGSVYSGDSIFLYWNALIEGVAIGKHVDPGDGSVGSIVETTSYPPNIYPTSPTSCVSENAPTPKDNSEILVNSNDIVLGYGDKTYGKVNPLKPGSYGKLRTNGDNVLTLTGGVYYFKNIQFDWNTNLYLDLSNGDITIFCLDYFNDGTTNDIQISTNGSSWVKMADADIPYAKQVYLEAHGPITLVWNADWYGTLFSTDSIVFEGGNTIIGSYATVGKSQVEWSANVTFVQSNYAAANW